MSFSNLEWYGWVIFVLTVCSLWADIIVAGVLIMHADKVKRDKDERVSSGGFLWTAIGIALTLHWMSAP